MLDQKSLDSKMYLELEKSNLTPLQFALLTQEYTLNYLEQKYGQPIKRYVRLGRGRKADAEFDGKMMR